MASLNIEQVVLSVWIVTVFLIGHGSALTFTASPDPFTDDTSGQLTIKCQTGGAAYTSNDVVSMQISKGGGKPIVVVDTRSGLKRGPSHRSNMQVEGRIVRDGSNPSHVTVTIQDPQISDSGTYSCLVFYTNALRQIKEDKVTVYAKFDSEDTKSITSFLMEKVSHLETTVGQLTEQDQKNKETMVSLQQTVLMLTDTVTHQRSLIEDQNNAIKNQNTSLAIFRYNTDISFNNMQEAMKTRVLGNAQHRCVFSQMYSSHDKVKAHSILKFTVTYLNIGNAYDVTTGKFTAPYSGVYVFHLNVRTKAADGRIDVSLKMSGKTTVAALSAHDKDFWDQVSTSAVQKLKAGDTIYPLVGSMTGIDVLSTYSRFSGYLIYKT